MTKFSGIYAIILFSLVLLFGLGGFAMGHHEGPVGGCLAVTATGLCPDESFLGSAVFHLDIYKDFMRATFASDTFLVFAGFIFFLLALFYLRKETGSFVFSRFHKREFLLLVPLAGKISKWLALHENSPSSNFSAEK